MRFGDRRTSDNVERGESGGFGLGGGGFGGAGAGMLLSLVFSRFGIGGVVVLLLLMFLFAGNPLERIPVRIRPGRQPRGWIARAWPRSTSPARLR